jgi:hypothetical protein
LGYRRGVFHIGTGEALLILGMLTVLTAVIAVSVAGGVLLARRLEARVPAGRRDRRAQPPSR